MLKKFFAVVIFLMLQISGILGDEKLEIIAHPLDQKIVSKQIEKFRNDIAKFHRKLGKYPDLKITLRISKNNKEYKQLANYYGLNKPEFSNAFFTSKENLIVIRNPKKLDFSKINQTLLHEYIHMFIHHYWHNAPLWFHEGMAVYFSEGINIEKQYNLIKFTYKSSDIPLEKMNNYPRNRNKMQYFYGKSALVIKFLYTEHKQQFFKFIDTAKPKKYFNSHFDNSFYFTLRTFSKLSEQYFKQYILIASFLSISSFIWISLPFLLFIISIKKKIINYRIKKKWLAEEKELD